MGSCGEEMGYGMGGMIGQGGMVLGYVGWCGVMWAGNRGVRRGGVMLNGVTVGVELGDVEWGDVG